MRRIVAVGGLVRQRERASGRAAVDLPPDDRERVFRRPGVGVDEEENVPARPAGRGGEAGAPGSGGCVGDHGLAVGTGPRARASSAISAGDSSRTGTIREIMRRPDASIRRHADSDAGRRARGRRVAADGAVESRAAVRRGDPSRVPDRAARPDLRGGLRRRQGAAVVSRGTGAASCWTERRTTPRSTASSGRSRSRPTVSSCWAWTCRPFREALIREIARRGIATPAAAVVPARGRPAPAPRRGVAPRGPAGGRRESRGGRARAARASSRRSEPRSSRKANGGRSIPPRNAFVNLNTLEQYAALRERA